MSWKDRQEKERGFSKESIACVKAHIPFVQTLFNRLPLHNCDFEPKQSICSVEVGSVLKQILAHTHSLPMSPANRWQPQQGLCSSVLP